MTTGKPINKLFQGGVPEAAFKYIFYNSVVNLSYWEIEKLTRINSLLIGNFKMRSGLFGILVSSIGRPE